VKLETHFRRIGICLHFWAISSNKNYWFIRIILNWSQLINIKNDDTIECNNNYINVLFDSIKLIVSRSGQMVFFCPTCNLFINQLLIIMNQYIFHLIFVFNSFIETMSLFWSSQRFISKLNGFNKRFNS